MTVYTGRGDDGETDLFDGSRVEKTDPRVRAYGTVDELNAIVGMVRPTGYADVDERLGKVQNHLHVIQAELANPDPDSTPAIEESAAGTLEDWIDGWEMELDPPGGFVLPGGGEPGAGLHHARTVCRRAEREAFAVESGVSGSVLTYLNRLSDALFVMARVANARDGEAEQQPSY
ncbi:MAG: cob(I)yrinic acid a,c-diamide adenosyltransferase [Halodesulfurarchaeum sp.]